MILRPDDRWEKNPVSPQGSPRAGIEKIGSQVIGLCTTVMQPPNYVETHILGMRWILLERNDSIEIFSIQLRSGFELRVIIDRQYGLPDQFSVNGGEWELVRNWNEISTLIGGMRGSFIVGPLQERQKTCYCPGVSPVRGLNDQGRKWPGSRRVA